MKYSVGDLFYMHNENRNNDIKTTVFYICDTKFDEKKQKRYYLSKYLYPVNFPAVWNTELDLDDIVSYNGHIYCTKYFPVKR